MTREDMIEEMAKNSPHPEFTRKILTTPTGKDFRDGLKELPVDMHDAPNQVHITMAPRGPAEVAWSTLAGKCHMDGLKPLGYIDHIIKHDGKKLRAIRIILADPKGTK